MRADPSVQEMFAINKGQDAGIDTLPMPYESTVSPMKNATTEANIINDNGGQNGNPELIRPPSGEALPPADVSPRTMADLQIQDDEP